MWRTRIPSAHPLEKNLTHCPSHFSAGTCYPRSRHFQLVCSDTAILSSFSHRPMATQSFFCLYYSIFLSPWSYLRVKKTLARRPMPFSAGTHYHRSGNLQLECTAIAMLQSFFHRHMTTQSFFSSHHDHLRDAIIKLFWTISPQYHITILFSSHHDHLRDVIIKLFWTISPQYHITTLRQLLPRHCFCSTLATQILNTSTTC
jgi:hypothetical protein